MGPLQTAEMIDKGYVKQMCIGKVDRGNVRHTGLPPLPAGEKNGSTTGALTSPETSGWPKCTSPLVFHSMPHIQSKSATEINRDPSLPGHGATSVEFHRKNRSPNWTG